jgi:hypothetical protein
MKENSARAAHRLAASLFSPHTRAAATNSTLNKRRACRQPFPLDRQGEQESLYFPILVRAFKKHKKETI